MPPFAGTNPNHNLEVTLNEPLLLPMEYNTCDEISVEAKLEMDMGIEERRVAIEAIATLAHIKRVMVDLILKPAGVPKEVFEGYLYRRDDLTGRQLSKRQIAPLIIETAEKRTDCRDVVRRIVEIAAGWSSFHLADDEFVARATVQKARELMGQIELMEAREAQAREIARKEELARMERERATLFGQRLQLLLQAFEDPDAAHNPQRRGYNLQMLLNQLFDLHDIPVVRPFVRNDGAEQIDGTFKLDGWHYLVECRWRQKLADIRELDGLIGQIDRSGKQTMGLFLAVNGWSENVVPMLKQNPHKCIVLMEGYDLRTVLAGQVDLHDFLVAKVAKLNIESEPFLGVNQYLDDQRGA